MAEEFDWREFFGCLDIPEKVILTFIDTIRAAAFFVLADLTDTTAAVLGLNGIRYEVFKQTYIVDEFYIGNETRIRFYEIDRPLFKGLRTYFNEGHPSKCLTVGIWNSV